ncbi:MAG: methyltransferase domain-containing protein [Candidatus Omnitrophota bacterium]|jgi:ubiquinone/menaquinone biosynthesis C-methylase UbiE|nr:MAG: methyltransferase domain-containing protein [Candidatus Omnitrophota bacterium]
MKHPIKNYFKISAIAITLILIVNSPSGAAEREGRRFNPGSFEEPARAEWQKVEEVIKAIDLREGQSIADIGGGSGYFSRPFAKAVGPTGVVYCCDIATEPLEYLQTTALEQNLLNIVTVFAAYDRPMLPPNSLDILFFCNTNHHLDNRVDYYKNLIPLLRKGGKLVVVDWKKEQQKVGPPHSHCVAKSVVIEEMKQAGWELIQEETFLPYQYFLVFEPVIKR